MSVLNAIGLSCEKLPKGLVLNKGVVHWHCSPVFLSPADYVTVRR